MQQTDQSKELILQNATQLLKFTSQVCQERGKQNLVAIFRDDIIRLTVEEKKSCALVRLYNTFHEFEPRVLQMLNQFLPQELRYDVQMDNQGNILRVSLAPVLEQHLRTCQELHLAPEEDQYDVFLTSLSRLVGKETGEQFKQLLSKFVKGQPETRMEVLQFIIKSAELLGDYPELLAGLLEYLNSTWFDYAVHTMKFASVQQISLAYGCFNENAQVKEQFRRIVDLVIEDSFTPQQRQWRQTLIKNIREKVQEINQMCSNVMDQIKMKQSGPTLQHLYHGAGQGLQNYEVKQIQGRSKQRSTGQPAAKNQVQAPPIQLKPEQQEALDSLNDMRIALESRAEAPESYDVMLANITEYFNSNTQFAQILDVKVPINVEIVHNLYKKLLKVNFQSHKEVLNNTDEVEEKHEEEDLKNDNEKKNEIEIAKQSQHNNFKTHISSKQIDEIVNLTETVRESEGRSMMWQNAAQNWIARNSEPTMQYIELDDAIELSKAIQFRLSGNVILEQVDKGIPYKQVQNLLISIFNNIVLRQHYELLQNNVISRRFLQECVLFFNQHADDAYGSECYAPIAFLDESRAQADYMLVDIDSQKNLRPLGNHVFTLFEKQLHNISLYQKHKFYKRNKNITESKEPKDPRDQSCNYKFVHPVRSKCIDNNCVLNRNYYCAFANGHENTAAIGNNPYDFVMTDSDVERQFGEIDDGNILEEQLMRYDIFIANLRMTQRLLEIYCQSLQSTAERPNNEESDETIQLQLPAHCQQLLKAVIGAEYFETLQIYTKQAAPLVLKRVGESLAELTRWRELAVAPAFSARICRVYFQSLDFLSRPQAELDKKLLQQKQFFVDLQGRKAVACMLDAAGFADAQAKKTKPTHACPWEFETYFSGEFQKGQAGFGRPPEYFQSISQKALVPGCKCLQHQGELDVQGIQNRQFGFNGLQTGYEAINDIGFQQMQNTQTNTNNQSEAIKEFIKSDLWRVFGKAFSGTTVSRNQKQHYCCDVHNIFYPVNQIQNPELYKFLTEYIVRSENIEQYKTQRIELLRMLSSVILMNNQMESIKIIDQSIYCFYRFFFAVLERLSYLYNIISKMDKYQIQNFQHLIFKNQTENIDLQDVKTSFQQFLLKKQICQQFDELVNTQSEYQIEKGQTLWETLCNCLLSQRQQTETDILSLFGSQAFIGNNLRNIMKHFKKSFDDLFEGYQRFQAVVEVYQSGTTVGKDVITACQQPIMLSGFLLNVQYKDRIQLLTQTGNDRLLLPTEIEQQIKPVVLSMNQSLLVTERIDDFMCFSEIDM